MLNSARSVSLDGLHLVKKDGDGDDFSASADSLRSGAPGAGGHRRSADEGYVRPLTTPPPGIVVTPPPLSCGSLREHHRKNDVARAAWEVSNRYERRTHAARQMALRTAAILHMRKNSTVLQMAGIERSASPVSEPDVTLLRDRLTALDLQLQETTVQAQEQLSHLHCSREQHLQLLRELNDLGPSDDLLEQFPDDGAEDDLLVRSLPCLALPPPPHASAKPKKMAGLKKVAIGTAFGRALSSKLQKPSAAQKPQVAPPLPPQHSSPKPPTSSGKRGSSQFYAPLLDVTQKPSPSSSDGDVSFYVESEAEEEDEPSSQKEISPEALAEIASFKRLIDAYFTNYTSLQPSDMEQLFS